MGLSLNPFTGFGMLDEIGDLFSPKQQTSTTTTNQGPWGETVPYWKQVYGDIFGTPGATMTTQTPSATTNLLGTTGKPNPLMPKGLQTLSTTTTPGTQGLLQQQLNNPNSYTQQYWAQAANYANNPQSSALLGGAQNYANRVLGGEFLDPTKNLALAQQLQRGMENLHAWDTSANLAGRYGGGAWGAGRGRQLADLQGNLYGQGLNQMTQMAGMAPQLWSAGLMPTALLGQIGQEQEQRPWNLYNQATSLLRGTGSSGTTTQPYYQPSTFQQLLGPALTIGGAILGGPGGAAAGASIGNAFGGSGGGYNPNYQNPQLYGGPQQWF